MIHDLFGHCLETLVNQHVGFLLDWQGLKIDTLISARIITNFKELFPFCFFHPITWVSKKILLWGCHCSCKKNRWIGALHNFLYGTCSSISIESEMINLKRLFLDIILEKGRGETINTCHELSQRLDGMKQYYLAIES